MACGIRATARVSTQSAQFRTIGRSPPFRIVTHVVALIPPGLHDALCSGRAAVPIHARTVGPAIHVGPLDDL